MLQGIILRHSEFIVICVISTLFIEVYGVYILLWYVYGVHLCMVYYCAQSALCIYGVTIIVHRVHIYSPVLLQLTESVFYSGKCTGCTFTSGTITEV